MKMKKPNIDFKSNIKNDSNIYVQNEIVSLNKVLNNLINFYIKESNNINERSSKIHDLTLLFNSINHIIDKQHLKLCFDLQKSINLNLVELSSDKFYDYYLNSFNSRLNKTLESLNFLYFNSLISDEISDKDLLNNKLYPEIRIIINIYTRLKILKKIINTPVKSSTKSKEIYTSALFAKRSIGAISYGHIAYTAHTVKKGEEIDQKYIKVTKSTLYGAGTNAEDIDNYLFDFPISRLWASHVYARGLVTSDVSGKEVIILSAKETADSEQSYIQDSIRLFDVKVGYAKRITKGELSISRLRLQNNFVYEWYSDNQEVLADLYKKGMINSTHLRPEKNRSEKFTIDVKSEHINSKVEFNVRIPTYKGFIEERGLAIYIPNKTDLRRKNIIQSTTGASTKKALTYLKNRLAKEILKKLV